MSIFPKMDWKRFIAVLCMALVCMSAIRAVAAANPDQDRARQISRDIEIGAGIAHYCQASDNACGVEPSGHKGGSTHHHHGESSSSLPTAGTVTATPAPGMGAMVWAGFSSHRAGLGKSSLDRPPKA